MDRGQQSVQEEVEFLRQALPALPPRSTKVVLVSTGSFNPVHRLHLEICSIAKQELEQRGMRVVCTLLAPSSDEYVSAKLLHEAIPFVHRRDLLLLMANQFPSLAGQVFISKAESHMGLFYGEVIQFYQKLFKRSFPEHIIKVIYVCGSDRGLRFNHPPWDKDGVVVVERPTDPLGHRKPPEHIIIAKGHNEDVSSSAIRKQGYDSPLISSDISDYLKKHKLLGPCYCRKRMMAVVCTCDGLDQRKADPSSSFESCGETEW